MNAFALPAGTRLTVTKATPRKETHGDDHVQAISLRLSWTALNDSLYLLHPQLRDMLFFDPPEVVAQLQIEGLAPVKKHRRVPTVAMPIKLDREHTGYTLTIDHGIDASSALELYSCTVAKFAVDAHEGGSVTISWSVASNRQITPELLGALCALEGDEITASLAAPGAPEAVIDGTQAAFDADHPADDRDAGELFAEQHGGDDGRDQHAGDFGAGSDDVADEQAELEAGLRSRWPTLAGDLEKR